MRLVIAKVNRLFFHCKCDINWWIIQKLAWPFASMVSWYRTAFQNALQQTIRLEY
jgi:hypothetical protein